MEFYVWSLYNSAAFLYVRARSLLQVKRFFNRFIEYGIEIAGRSGLGTVKCCESFQNTNG